MSARAVLTALLAAGLLVAGCGGSDADDTSPSGSETTFRAEDPGPVHVHGVGINPADGALFVATHTGLFRAAADETTATRVGDTFQDTMGFTVVGPNRFLGSGHPDLRTDQPPYLGLIRSDDAGETWQPVSLLGEVDFHVLEAAGDRIVGFGSDFRTREPVLAVSDDAGRTWQRRADPPALISVAISPDAPDTWVASTPRRLLRTTDAGRSWEPLPGRPGLLSFDGTALLAVDGSGAASSSPDGGRSWTHAGDVGGQPAAFEATEAGLLVALHDGTIKLSTDRGQTWAVRAEP